MLNSKIYFLFFLFVPILFLNNCDAVSDKNDDCEDKKWAQTKEPILYVYINVWNLYCDPPTNAYYVPAATQMTFTGKITKIYCNGTISGSFDINTTFFPAQMNADELTWVKVGQAYQFKFQHDNDYLLFTGSLRGTFSDGKKFESAEFTLRIYYRDISYNVNTFENWVLYSIPVGSDWYEVN